MKQGKNSQLIPVIVIVVVVVVSVALIVSLVRTFFFNGGQQQANQQDQRSTDQAALLNTAVDRGVRMTIRGDITADEKFRSYQIVVTPNRRTMTTYAGYLDQQLEHVALENNGRAYEEFVYALNRAGMANGTAFSGEKDDTRGLCPNGKILEFETLHNDKSVKRLWATTCKIKGSLQANANQLSSMFLDQIPQGKELLKKINQQ